MVGYPSDAPWHRVYNPETRRIITFVHVVFHENTLGFGTRLPIDSVISDPSDDDSIGTPHYPPTLSTPHCPILNPLL
jgi:hypothetical protein